MLESLKEYKEKTRKSLWTIYIELTKEGLTSSFSTFKKWFYGKRPMKTTDIPIIEKYLQLVSPKPKLEPKPEPEPKPLQAPGVFIHVRDLTWGTGFRSFAMLGIGISQNGNVFRVVKDHAQRNNDIVILWAGNLSYEIDASPNEISYKELINALKSLGWIIM